MGPSIPCTAGAYPGVHHLVCVSVVTPARGVDDDGAQAARDDTGNGEGDDPAHVDPGDHAPVDRPPGARAETDTDGSSGDALRGGDGELCEGVGISYILLQNAGSRTETGSKDDGDGGTKFHGETTRGGVKGQAVAEDLHDVVTVGPDTEGNSTAPETPGYR